MDAERLIAAVRAMDIGIFEQGPDGAFVSVAPPPEWMAVFSRNPTFPFLGSFLIAARDFWKEPRDGRLTWGPCAEIDASGQQFHYTVSALSVPDHKFLVFELDPNAVDAQAMLQKARDAILERHRPPARSTDSTAPGLSPDRDLPRP